MSDRGEDAGSTAPSGAQAASGPPNSVPGPRVPGYHPVPGPPGPGARSADDFPVPAPQPSGSPAPTSPTSELPGSGPYLPGAQVSASPISSPGGYPAPAGYAPPPAGALPPGTRPTSAFPLGPYAPMRPSAAPFAGRPPSEQHRASRLLGLGGFGLALVLLFVAAVQALLLLGLSADLNRTKTAQSRTEAVNAQQQEDLGNLTKRIKSLEERTAGALNSTAVAKKVLPSVFRVRAGTATGTAFAFGQDASGGTLLVTNYHVVSAAMAAGAKTATIERSSQIYPVTIDRTDQARDLVVLHAAAKFVPLIAATAEVEPGDPVIVVGAPLGLDNTVTTGVVSAIRDDVKGLTTRVIQFDAAINPGNSGGPVINANGQVVGVAQAKIVAEGADGIGLAIPIAEVCKGLISC